MGELQGEAESRVIYEHLQLVKQSHLMCVMADCIGVVARSSG